MLRALCRNPGIANAEITTVGSARFPSIQQWMYIDIKGWTLAMQLTTSNLRCLFRKRKRLCIAMCVSMEWWPLTHHAYYLGEGILHCNLLSAGCTNGRWAMQSKDKAAGEDITPTALRHKASCYWLLGR